MLYLDIFHKILLQLHIYQRLAFPINEVVITSYSIHYTKLYDLVTMVEMADAITRAANDEISKVPSNTISEAKNIPASGALNIPAIPPAQPAAIYTFIRVPDTRENWPT